MQRPATREDTIDLLNEVLKGRLRETFEKFCTEIPEILDGLQQTATASPEGREFVRTLLAWVGGASRRSEQASRYFLMWYAKTLAGKSAHEKPDCRVVAELLRKHLRQDELEAVDQALADGWKVLEKSRSLNGARVSATERVPGVAHAQAEGALRALSWSVRTGVRLARVTDECAAA